MPVPANPPAPAPAPSVLAVFAHPDDESLSAGGVLARHAAAGARTAVVTATWAPETPRAAELAEALRILGAGQPRMLGHGDARAAWSAPGKARFCDVPIEQTVSQLVWHIREFRPQIVVTHDAYGGLSGHPDHVHTHRVTLLAVHAAGLDLLHPEAGEPWQPGALYLATHPHTAAREVGAHLLRPGALLRSVPDERVTATVDVGPWVEQKVAAILAHRTEVARGAAPGRVAALSAAVRARVLGTEWYIRHEPVPRTAPRTELTA
ncbi:PIG-L family deacetylase [Kitasatospora sp. NBC_01287]|uniref:PIG-L family deacetylase n=1 Tax=Kitasatospora sp. NBC_01287 TaxID=2903573 RepID=UPI002250E78A|nr:PIG-L family deacetylase [Kitasatospora sp. NBC_01287]MCX4751539.1 PIG-L family deacetylase [Kitasatospora sp. NBC_01287]